MQAAQKRNIGSGREYDQLIPKPKGMSEVILKSGDTFDTVSTMKKVVASTLPQTALLAPVLEGKNRNETCRNIWDFIYNNIQYTYDWREGDIEAIERVRTPARTWADRKQGADCEDYSIITSSILTNLGIPHSFKKTKYNNSPSWQHIYVVVPKATGRGYYTIDAVVDAYNYEAPGITDKQEFPMPVPQTERKEALAGVPQSSFVNQEFYEPMYPTLEAKLFSNSGHSGLAGNISGAKPSDSKIKGWVKDQQVWANRNHKGNLYGQLKAGGGYYTKKAPGSWQHRYYIYHDFDMGKIMADVKRAAPSYWKPEYEKYLPKQVATTNSNLPAAIDKAGIQKYLTKRNAMIGGGVLVGGAILYSLFK